MTQKHRRKARYIDREIQGAILLHVTRQWLTYLCVTFVFLTVVRFMFAGPGETIRSHFAAVWSDHAIFYIAAAMMLPAFLNDVIKLSHRFVGPVFRVRSELKRIAAGEQVKPIKLRKHDLWVGLADDFNAALERLNGANAAADSESTADEKPSVDEVMEAVQQQQVPVS
ncbi:hypothetical protein Mal4_33060 [Maioricimonas rarisocia]|uniref:HAMP domain-containing protein n=1 Tax=Maioricimonas rarisocia TaxID=2528026 RepID=A0A517Z922_9PLAN|nr:hypothetical protein [Maioricimonas rarisocia]QDU38974.1 hypothetical protein Mal4_33060 [Maioricimonas rarisocia]